MAEAGVELVADYHEVAVVGIAEVVHKIPSVIGVQRLLAREARAARSGAGDSGGFAGNASRRGAAPEERAEFPSATSSGRRCGRGARAACASSSGW